MPAPWENDPVVQPRAASGHPGIIPGRPKPVDPYKVRDQELQEQAAAQSAAQFKAQQIREDRRDARQVTQDAMGGAEQGKAASFLERAINAEKSYGGLDNPSPRSLPGQIIANNAPDLANYASDATRQQADQAEREFIAAVLRYDSGAAIPTEELVTNGRIYFPRPGDSPEVVAQKARSRNVAIKSLLSASGPIGQKFIPDIDALSAPQGGGDPNDPAAELEREYGEQGLTGRVTDETPAQPDPEAAKINEHLRTNPEGADGLFTLAKQGLSGSLSDEAAGIGGSIAALLTGNDMGQAYTANRDAERLNIAEARRYWPNAGTAAEITGMLASGGGNALNALAPTGWQAAKGAGIFSGVTAFGAGDGLDQSVRNAAIAVPAGAAAGLALQRGGQYLANRAANRPAPAFDRDVVEAGARMRVPIRQPDARADLRGDLAKAEASSYGGARVAQTLKEDKALVGQRLTETGGPGTALTQNYNLGGRVQGAGKRFIAESRTTKNANYADAERLAAGGRVTPQNAIAAVDQNIAELEASGANSNRAVIEYLKGLRADLSKSGGFSITEFQGLRSATRNKIKGDQALTASDADRRLGNVVRAFTDDADAQLPKAAASALKSADKFYAERQDFIGKVLKPFMGSKAKPMSPEDAGKAFRAMFQNKADYNRMQRFWKEASPGERADFTATLAAGLGKGKNGEFGLGALATNIENVPANLRALVFGKDGSRALEDLRIIARAKSDTAGGLNNSRSGVVVARQIGLRALLAATMGGGASGGSLTATVAAPAAVEVVSAIGQRRAARLLLDPNFTRWLRQAPNASSPAAIDAYFRKLTTATKGTVIANDVQAFQSALATAFSKSPRSVAAAEGEQEQN